LGLGESIKRDHDAYRRFFAKMSKTTEKDGAARTASLKDIMSQIYAHHKAEELTIFPAMMKIPQLRGLAFELEVEHNDMRRLFDALKNDKADVEVWKYKLSSIYDIMHAHWLKEEEQLTPFGLDFFSEAEWKSFGERFDGVIRGELDGKANDISKEM
jgi:hemerythrin superfamily protein